MNGLAHCFYVSGQTAKVLHVTQAKYEYEAGMSNVISPRRMLNEEAEKDRGPRVG